jgi:hypothetical protein
VKARPAGRIVCRRESAAGLHASRDSFYRTTRNARQPRSGVIPLALLPRLCPLCHSNSIIGHGRRLRQANDDGHQRLWVRRGICRPCRKTFTILPEWLSPCGHFTLRCRQQACARISDGDGVEQSAPHCRDPARLPDPSTIRRWCWRRVVSLWCWAGSSSQYFLRAPTILAWDFAAWRRILPLEARSP